MNEQESVIHHFNTFRSRKSLYNNPIFAIAILKLMDSNTTKLIFDLLVSSIHVSHLSNIKNIKESINVLIKMDFIYKNEDIVSLDNKFRVALLEGFCNENYSIKFISSNKDGDMIHSAIALADVKFQKLLQSIVNQADKHYMYVKDILSYCNLIDSFNQITNKGFEFLLNTKKDQVWFLITNSIKYFAKTLEEEAEMLLDLMEICIKRKVCEYSPVNWCEWYTFLESIGIFYRTEKNNSLIINNLYLFDKANSSAEQSRKYIILETNYKIYAYTTKEYEKSILSLFSKIVYCLPNLIKGQFDEESMSAAFSRGITAKQIIKYLNEFSEAVPPSISNQIFIWEAKQYRIKAKEGVLYCDFLHLSDYLKLLQFLEKRNAVLFQDEAKRILVSSDGVYEETKEFLKGL